MLVLFVVGLMNLAWMIAVGAAFVVERNWRGGAAVARVLGIAVFGLGFAVLVHPSVLTTVASMHRRSMMSM